MDSLMNEAWRARRPAYCRNTTVPLPTHGILAPESGALRFTLERHAPSDDLAWIVERYWSVRWSLAAPYDQETLPFPCVNLVIGTHRPGIHGIRTTRFVAALSGDGWAFGVKFRPGGFRPLIDFPAHELTDRE